MVKRYHTWPTVQQQTVADHTWQVMRIYCEVFGAPDHTIWEYLLWHDAGEIVTGDLPFPIKAENPAIKARTDALERKWLWDTVKYSEKVTDYDKVACKVCDLIEMYEFGVAEISMGNIYGFEIRDDCRRAVTKKIEDLTIEDREKVRQYMRERNKVIV